jgi:hypothetical protein
MIEFLTPRPDETYQGSLFKNVPLKGWQTAIFHRMEPCFGADGRGDGRRYRRRLRGRSTIVSCQVMQSFSIYVRNVLPLFVEGSSTTLIRSISRMPNITAGRSTFVQNHVLVRSCPTLIDFIWHIGSRHIKPGCRSNKV